MSQIQKAKSKNQLQQNTIHKITMTTNLLSDSYRLININIFYHLSNILSQCNQKYNGLDLEKKNFLFYNFGDIWYYINLAHQIIVTLCSTVPKYCQK